MSFFLKIFNDSEQLHTRFDIKCYAKQKFRLEVVIKLSMTSYSVH